MKRNFTISAIIIVLLGVIPASAMDTGQKAFSPLVRTIQVRNPDNFMGIPVLNLRGGNRLEINFDIIGNQHEYLRFRLIHCNADWQPSRLMESEYLDTFNEFEIEDFAYSENTFIHYVNYNISLPDPNIPIKYSGNYLLQVYPENSPSDVYLQVRFSVSEEAIRVNGYQTTRTDKGVNSDFQQVGLIINSEPLGNINPYKDIIVNVVKNNEPENSRIIDHPMRAEGKNIFYEHLPQLVFEAGNEYRRFETVKADYAGMNVDSVRFVNGMWHAWIKPDYSRKDNSYIYDQTQHGRFKIDEFNSSEPDLGADYIMTHFSLDPGERQKGKIYLDGDFTNHLYDDSTLLKYNWETGLYQVEIPLKQGSYNYRYITVDPDRKQVSSVSIEGNKYETRNEYRVNVFLRTPGSRGDRLVSSTIL